MKIYCPTHGVQTTRPCPACRKQRDRARGSAASRGYGRAWRKLRAEILPDHLELLCEWEGGGCTERATEVHHRDGNPANNDPSNHQRLCKSHHSRITAAQRRGSAA